MFIAQLTGGPDQSYGSISNINIQQKDLTWKSMERGYDCQLVEHGQIIDGPRSELLGNRRQSFKKTTTPELTNIVR